MSTSSSSSSSGNGRGNASSTHYIARRGGDYEAGPTRIRPLTPINDVWPEPFVEALAAQVAIEAARFAGRLAAAQALANVFQVCSMWRTVSRSDLLWHHLTHRIWGRTQLLHSTWRDEFIFRHQTARNFRTRRSSHFTLHFDLSSIDDADALICRCIALSDHYLACGFANGVVCLFDLSTHLHIRTLYPQHRDRLGRFSRAVSGIVFIDAKLVFASLDGDIHVVMLDGNAQPRRAHFGDVVNDGSLVDFTGCRRWWVGLYAGVPGRAFHIWDGNTEELTFVGGSLTNSETVMGWHLLTEFTEFVGRVRMTSEESAVACTSSMNIVFDLMNQGLILDEEEFRRPMMVSSFGVWNEAYIMVDSRGLARVRRVGTREEVCRFNVRVERENVMGCINGGYALMCAGGLMRVWEIEQGGELLYNFQEIVGEVNALVANERHVAIASYDTTIHLWDFGAELE
ncbi:hypothetical protein K2173_018359 [Erythroxylum novogranatense]|uniref:Transcriptional regulator STERILE APETALA n=1 Tax=Erythroxylum novogranatense TaxID=1862640 RepID=A0AAV8UA74_9ROSI|nr:hypothetical protein K2173_018359 [Erythroxylum novogranatense]